MVQELSFCEVDLVNGAGFFGDLADWGTQTAATGGAVAVSGAAVTQLDSPLIGPADAVGGAMIVAGAATAVVGGAAFVVGSIGEAFGG